MAPCRQCMSDELAPEKFGFHYDRPEAFVKPQFGRRWGCFVLYRLVVSGLITTWLVFDLLDETKRFYDNRPALWFLFATNWSFFILALTAFLQAVLSLYYFIRAKRRHAGEPQFDGMPVPLVILWIFYDVAANGALVVSVCYWTFLAIWDSDEFLVTPMSHTKHSVNTVYVLFDLFVSGTPIRILHLIYPLIAGTIYTIFNAAYFTNNGLGPNGKHYAYNMMDWRKPVKSAITCSMGYVLSVLVQLLLYAIFRLRMKLYNKLLRAECKGKESEHLAIVASEIADYNTMEEGGVDNQQLVQE